MPNARQDLLPDGCRRVAVGIMIMSSEELASFLRVNTVRWRALDVEYENAKVS